MKNNQLIKIEKRKNDELFVMVNAVRADEALRESYNQLLRANYLLRDQEDYGIAGLAESVEKIRNRLRKIMEK